MEFKKRMLSDFTAMVNDALSTYKREYEDIMAETLNKSKNTHCHDLSSENIQEKNNTNNKEMPIKAEDDSVHIENTIVPNTTPQSITNQDKAILDYSRFNDIIRCDAANSTLFESGMVSSLNQSFYNGERIRKKAKRRTGKILSKRKYEVVDEKEDDNFVKRQRTDQIEKFNFADSNLKKAEIKEYEYKIKMLENKLKESEERQKNQLDIAIFKILEAEAKKIQDFKESITSEIKKLQDIKTNQTGSLHLDEHTIKEKKALENEMIEQRRFLEAEKTIIMEEKIKIEQKLLDEEKKLKEERLRFEREKNEEIKKILEERIKLEKEMAEKTFLFEKSKIDQSMIGHSSRLIQGILKPKEVKIQLPGDSIIDAEKRKTIFQKRSKPVLNELFQEAKKEHLEKVNQSQLISSKHFFTKPAPAAKLYNQPIAQLEKINAHNLYKKSIDVQSMVADPKKYIPKTHVPHYTTEDEFESDEKKFQPALFTKDPKLNYIVRLQDHEEIRNYFGDRKEIDVESIFNEIENVSNYSPNKLKKSG